MSYNLTPRGEVPERLNGTVSKTVVVLVATVGSNPTLSAGRKILVAAKAAHYRQPQSFGDMVLTDRGLTTEIAQFQLGDLTFQVHTPHWTKRFAQKISSQNPIPRTYRIA